MAEATPAIEAAGEAVTQVVLPESTVAPVETNAPENNQGTPEIGTPETPEATKAATDMAVYKGAIKKHEADSSYNMSDEEADIFLEIDEGVREGRLTIPEDEPEEPKPEIEAEKAADEEAEIPVETVTESPIDQLSNEKADSLQLAMGKVGAKDINELPEKIGLLVKKMAESGGSLGSELKESKATIQSMSSDRENFLKWTQDLAAGKPAAIDYLKQISGNPNANMSPQVQENSNSQTAGELGDFGDPEDYVDNQLSPRVQRQEKQIADLTKLVSDLTNKSGVQTQIAVQQEATNSWIDEVVDLVSSHKDSFPINASEARALAVDYWKPGNEQKAKHPKFQKVHELVTFAYENGQNNLADALVLFEHKNGDAAKKLIQATRDGQKSVQHTTAPNAAISGKQGRNQKNIPQANVSEDDVAKMAKGDFASIPDEWMDAEGTFIKSKVPERHHKAVFG